MTGQGLSDQVPRTWRWRIVRPRRALGASSRAPPAIGHRRGAVLARVGGRGRARCGGGLASLARVSRRSSRLAGHRSPWRDPARRAEGLVSPARSARLGRLEPAVLRLERRDEPPGRGSMSASGPTAEVGSRCPARGATHGAGGALHKAPRGRRERAKTSGGSRRAGPREAGGSIGDDRGPR